VLFTPKSLLRAPRAASRVEDYIEGRFRPVLDDPAIQDPERVRRVLLCSGKVYYDLAQHREERDGVEPGEARGDVAIVRAEELYPWPEQELREVMERYAGADRVTWVQEEPANMGAWTFVRERIPGLLRDSVKLAYAGRPASASPAVGSMRIHKLEQAALLQAAFQGLGG
jgi:2-oxoglutarate dehydrogenase E1 component